MARFGFRFVQGLALLLIAVAVPIVLWLPHPRTGEHRSGRLGSAGVRISDDFNVSGRQITYRFLCRDEAGAIEDRLTLGCFVGGDLQEGATWGFISAEHWYTWAPAIFDRERGWAAEHQRGWQISRWLCADESAECDSGRLFWAIQALRFLDPESLANEIDMLEASGRTVRICPTHGSSDYDYDEDTLYWNPALVEHVPVDASLDRQWFQTDPLITLAHELNHAWHDLCRNGDAVGVEGREQVAVAAENRIRHILFLKDPTRWHFYPRPGHQEMWPDLPGASAQEAWRNYHGRVQY